MIKEVLTEQDFKNRFQMITEYINLGNEVVDEAGEDDAPADGAPAPDGGDMGADPNMPPMGGGAPAPDGGMGGDTNAMGGGAPAMGGDPNAMDGGAPTTPAGLDPQEPAMGGMDAGMDAGMDPNAPAPEDDVVDITDLTDKQEETQEKVDEFGDKFEKVFHELGAMAELIKSQNAKIEDLGAEFEKRNPTQVEKLSMRSAHSYPFNVPVDEYWKEKEAESNYSIEDDNNGKEQGQYVITKNDVNGDTNWKGIHDTLEDDDLIYNQNLNNILKY